jgi:hypothetical protein
MKKTSRSSSTTQNNTVTKIKKANEEAVRSKNEGQDKKGGGLGYY